MHVHLHIMTILCRMIGGILTERTVGAVLPAVKENMEKLKVLILLHFALRTDTHVACVSLRH